MKTRSMLRLSILILLLPAHLHTHAQKEDDKLITGKTIQLTSPQQQWVNANYKKVAALKKDSVASLIRKKFPSITEASLEFMIGQAGKLSQGDQANQLAQLNLNLEQLKKQKQSLLDKINAKQNQLDKETSPGKRKAIENEILDLKKKYNDVLDNIRNVEEAIRRIKPVPPTPEEQALAATLFNELHSVGVDMNTGDLENLVNAMGKGGQSATALAQALLGSSAEIKSGMTGAVPASGRYDLTEQQIAKLSGNITGGKPEAQTLAQLLREKFEKLKKEKEKWKLD
jgi:hypothetical protein